MGICKVRRSRKQNDRLFVKGGRGLGWERKLLVIVTVRNAEMDPAQGSNI